MLALAILVCSAVFVTAFMPLVNIMQKNAAAAEILLNNTELRFNEELSHSRKKAQEAIRKIDDNVEHFISRTLNDTIRFFQKVDSAELERARNIGFNVTECHRIFVNLTQAANNLTEKKTFCVAKIVNSVNRYIKSIEKLAYHVHRNFTIWRARIHDATNTASYSESSDLAYETLKSTVENAEIQLTDNYIKMRQKIARIEELQAIDTSVECLRETQEYSYYKNKYLSFPKENEICIINVIAQTVELLKREEILKFIG